MDQHSYLCGADIDIHLKKLSISYIIKLIKSGDIILDNGFRRSRTDVAWNYEKQCCLIESLILRIPISTFCLEMIACGKYVVIDGWQRINVILNFMNVDNNKQFCLQGMEYGCTNKFNGYLFQELPRHIQRRIEEQSIPTYIIPSNVPDNIKCNIINRMYN